ncbi:MAG: WXG100 family type VII secretion target [Labedaea sp.]
MGEQPGEPLNAGSDDRYVTGGTNWDSYDLQQLIAMVNEKVDLPALIELADDWRTSGDGVVQAAHELGDALDQLMDFWSGPAAGQARDDVTLNAQWLGDLGATAYQIGTPIEEAAGALQAAREHMPQLPQADPAIAPGSAPDGAEVGGMAGGPLGAAIGATAAGADSAAQAKQAEVELKRQAVETMRRFETAAIGIDQDIPSFDGPSDVLRPRPEPNPTRPPVATTVTTTTTSTVLSWQNLTGLSDPGTAQQDFQGLSRTGAGHALPAAGGGGAMFGGGGATFTGMGGGRPSAGAGRAGPGGPSSGLAIPPQNEGVLRPAAAAGAGMLEPEGHGAGMAGGAPMGGMGAGAGAGTAGAHRRRVPVDGEEPFGLDKKASPPVIGL